MCKRGRGQIKFEFSQMGESGVGAAQCLLQIPFLFPLENPHEGIGRC